MSGWEVNQTHVEVGTTLINRSCKGMWLNSIADKFHQQCLTAHVWSCSTMSTLSKKYAWQYNLSDSSIRILFVGQLMNRLMVLTLHSEQFALSLVQPN